MNVDPSRRPGFGVVATFPLLETSRDLPRPRANDSLTNRAGMSFSFMRIMLATPRSIKDSPLAAGALGAGRVVFSVLRCNVQL